VAGERQGPMLAADDSDIDALLGETITKVGGDAQNVIAADARLQTMLDAAMLEPKKLVDPKSLPVRFSRLKAFSLSAAHYLLWCQEGDDSGGESLALRMGSGFHAALFANRELVAYDGRRAGKDWERFEQKHRERGAVILNRKEFSIAAGMVGAIKRHKRAMELLFDGTTVEHRIDWTFSGRACRGTPDAFRADGAWNVDLKSARCTEPRWFSREALKRHYHAQLANYDDGIEAASARARPTRTSSPSRTSHPSTSWSCGCPRRRARSARSCSAPGGSACSPPNTSTTTADTSRPTSTS
jgi:hypothetical protein